MKPMRERLRDNYQRLKGFVWNGFLAPELCPDVRSDQVLALMEIVEELERRIIVLEDLRRLESGVLPDTIRKERF